MRMYFQIATYKLAGPTANSLIGGVQSSFFFVVNRLHIKKVTPPHEISGASYLVGVGVQGHSGLLYIRTQS